MANMNALTPNDFICTGKTFDVERIQSQAILDDMPFVRNTLEFQQYTYHMTQKLALQLRAYCLSGGEQSTRTVDETSSVSTLVPDTWWDHLKRDYAPVWFLKLFPASLRKIDIQYPYHITHTRHVNMCPHADVPFSVGGAKSVHINFMEGPDWKRQSSSHSPRSHA